MSYKYCIYPLIKLNDKTGVTSQNISKTRIIPIWLYEIQLPIYGRYEERARPSSWLSDIGGNALTHGVFNLLKYIFRPIFQVS